MNVKFGQHFIDACQGHGYNGSWFMLNMEMFKKNARSVWKGESKSYERKFVSLTQAAFPAWRDPAQPVHYYPRADEFFGCRGGSERFKAAVGFINGLPLVNVLELFGIFIPLIFHGVYGLYIAYQSNLNTGQFSYGRNWAFALQRISGVITFIFVFWHVYQTRFQVAIGGITMISLA